MATHVERRDDELILTGFLRERLAGTATWSGLLVSNRLTERPDGSEKAPLQDFAVIVRSDGGSREGLGTYTCRFGIRIFGPDSDDNHSRTMGLARRVESLVQMAPDVVPEVAHCRSTHGPYRTPPTVSRPEAYLTCELVFVGTPIT